MSIIEKLGIQKAPWTGIYFTEPIEIISTFENESVCQIGDEDEYFEEMSENRKKECFKNALLISAAPEMLEALIEDSINSYNTDCNNPMFNCNPPIKHKKVIEKATGKTWEEIKELL